MLPEYITMLLMHSEGALAVCCFREVVIHRSWSWNRSSGAACSMAAKHGHSKVREQESYSTLAHRSFLSRTQLQHASKIFTLSFYSCVVLSKRALCPGPQAEQQAADRRCTKQGMAMFTSPVDRCLFLALPRPSSAAGSHALPATKAAFAFFQGWFSIIRSGAGSCSSSRIRASSHELCAGCSSADSDEEGRDWGVLLLGLNYVSHPLFNWAGARSECTWTQVLLPRGGVTGRGGSWRGGAAKFAVSWLWRCVSTGEVFHERPFKCVGLLLLCSQAEVCMLTRWLMHF